MRRVLPLLLGLAVAAGPAAADEFTLAVATNFLDTARALQESFEGGTGHRVVIVSGSTGQLYAQIVNGAPYDVFLAADQERPRLLADSGAGIRETLATYAVGRLVLWSRDRDAIAGVELERLAERPFRWIAIAEPAVAPYGAAARQALERLGIWQALEPRVVVGQNVAQAFAMAQTGNAEYGLIALAQAVAYDGDGAHRLVPDDLHEPILQDGIVLRRAAGNAAAAAFMASLDDPAARAMIEAAGYASP